MTALTLDAQAVSVLARARAGGAPPLRRPHEILPRRRAPGGSLRGEALSSQSSAHSSKFRPPGGTGVQAHLLAALVADVTVQIPAAVLAELYRGGGHDQMVDSLLSRYQAWRIIDTDRRVARLAGNLLAKAGRGSRDHVDAVLVATSILAGGGVILTGDPDDIVALASGHPTVHVESL